jgi:hypothetical protein
MKNFTFLVGSLFLSIATNAQNVGVGQATPIGKLHITQTSTATIPGVIIDQPGSTGTFGSGTTGSIGLLINATGSNARGLQLIQSGLSGAGQVINMTNASSNEYGFHVNNAGRGIGTYLYNTNSANAVSTLFAQHDGTGNVGNFLSNNTSNPTATIYGQHNGLGNVGSFLSNNAANTTATINAQHNGLGSAGYFFTQNTANTQPSVYGYQAGLGSAGYFYNQNALANQPTVYGFQAGLNSAGYFYTQNTANTTPGVYGFHEGRGSAGYFYNKNAANTEATVYGFQEGLGNAGYFYNKNTANTTATIYSFQEGTGHAGYFYNKNVATNSPTIYSLQEGLSNAGYFYNRNAANTSSALYALNAGLGRAITAYTPLATTTATTLAAQNDGLGRAIQAYTPNTAFRDFTAGIFNNGTSTAGVASGGLYVAHLNTATAAHNAYFYQQGTGRSLEINRINKLALSTDPALMISDSSLSRAANIQNTNSANDQVTLFVMNRGNTVGADGTYSSTFSTSGGRGVVGTAYFTGSGATQQASSITEAGPVGVQGVAQASSANQVTKGVAGYAIQHSGTSNNGTSNITPGYFSLMNSALSTITASGVAVRSANTNYKILGLSGSPAVSTSRENHNGKRVILFAPESPMPTYNDYGTGTLVNGKTHITIDPAFANMIYVNPKDNAPLRVIVQLEGDCKGVYVTNKTATGFDVVELNGGTSNVEFTYQIVANSKDYVDPYNGEKNTLQSLRFPELDKDLYEPLYKVKAHTQKTAEAQKVNASTIQAVEVNNDSLKK